MKAVGIDLGTTNSAVATYVQQDKRAAIVPNSEGDALTPSAVAIRKRNDKETRYVGKMATNFAGSDPRNTVTSVKRLMGRDFADPVVTKARKRLTYDVIQAAGGDPQASVVVGGKQHSPVQISGFILGKLREDATRTLGEDVTHAVITVPAYFMESQRAATRKAGEAAGLVVRKIIDEPTAAAVAFGLHLGDDDQRQVLVYDLGGGTFDISILNVVGDSAGRNQFQVLAYDGDNWLGGDDFDHAIVDIILESVKDNCGVDASADKFFLYRAKAAAETAKRQLSQQDEAEILIAPDGRFADPDTEADLIITRGEFEERVWPLIDRTMTLVRNALASQHLTADDITDVVLAGGSTMVPLVHETVERFFGHDKVRRNVNPMECVALGAGILAQLLDGVECPSCGAVNSDEAADCADCGHSLVSAQSHGDIGVYEVTGPAMGIAAVRGTQRDVFVPIIKRGTPYPLTRPERHTFLATDGRRIRVPVYEGDSPVASENNEQGVISFELEQEIAPDAPVEVAFHYDRNRIIRVEITAPGNPVQREELKHDAPRTPPPVLSSAIDETAMARKDLARAVERAQGFLKDYESMLSPDQAMKIRGHLKDVEQVMILGDPAEYRRMANILYTDLDRSGPASDIFFAQQATASADPEITKQINAVANNVKEALARGDDQTAGDQGRLLNAIVAKAAQEQHVAPIEDAENYQGLLRVFEGDDLS
jgi:molecular chaperone DnaK